MSNPVYLDSRKAPQEVQEFISLLKQAGMKGKIRKNGDRWEFFSPFATLDTDYVLGYEVYIIDKAEEQ